MGPARIGGLRASHGTAQASSSRAGVVTALVPANQLRIIGAGRPLEPRIRQGMEAFFQTDFSSVRIHEGLNAQNMGALAFTVGEQLHFAPGRYNPSTTEGLELIGHELAHVVQQRAGKVRNPYGQGFAIVQDPELEAAADELGRQAAVAQARFMAFGALAGGLIGSLPGALIGGLIGGLFDVHDLYVRHNAPVAPVVQQIDEQFPIAQVRTTMWDRMPGTMGATRRTQQLMQEVTARNHREIRRRLALANVQINGHVLVNAVDAAAARTPNTLCTDFAQNLRDELFGNGHRIPINAARTLNVNSMNHLVQQIAQLAPRPGTVLLYGNNKNVHTTTVVAVLLGHTIIVEQHPANPQVAFKTLARAIDEWRLGRALTPASADLVDQTFSSPLGIIANPPP